MTISSSPIHLQRGHVPAHTTVALLMGGWNSEREVSLMSGKGISHALHSQGYKVRTLDLTRNMQELITFLTPKPDIVFLGALHGTYVEDGRLQGLLDILQIPYTHSHALSSAISYHKPTALKIFQSIGIPIAKGGVYKWNDIKTRHPMHAPYVVKPIDEGSSVGVYIIEDTTKPLEAQVHWIFGDEVLVEEYIPGQELSCAVIENQALGVLELAPKDGFYDFTNKYTDGKTDHFMPARISPEVYDQIMKYTEQAHKALECSGVTRCDIRYDAKTGRMAFLEINTLPGFTSLSIVPEIAAYRGISYDQLVYSLIEVGLCRALPR